LCLNEIHIVFSLRKDSGSMLIFDLLKKDDPQLRVVAILLAGGFLVLLTGLWWVQIVTTNEYKSHLETQSYRTVSIPAMRGRIMDCQGRVLAENGPRYNLSLYFGDLSGEFQREYARLRPMKMAARSRPFWDFWNGSSLVARKYLPLSKYEIGKLKWQARYDVANGIVAKMSRVLEEPLTFDYKGFTRAYQSSVYVPYPISQGLNTAEIARFEENYSGNMGVDLDVQTTRIYPFGKTAGHVLGYVERDDSSDDQDEFFNYRLPDYRGVVGIEGGFNKELHGHPGEELVTVNNLARIFHS